MKKFLFMALLATCLVGVCHAQTEDEKNIAQIQFAAKVRKLVFYNTMLPVLMSKEQIRQILPLIEKGRERVRRVLLDEYNDIKPFQPQVDDAIKAAEDKGAVPTRDLLDKLAALVGMFKIRRAGIAEVNEDDVYDAAKKALKPSQMKILSNSINVKDYIPTAKPETMSEEDKVRLFVRNVLLDPDAYPVLVKLSI
jgi:hypothetical protein